MSNTIQGAEMTDTTKTADTVADFIFGLDQLQVTQEYKPSERFKTPFRLRNLSAAEVADFQALTQRGEGGARAMDYVISHSVVVPDLESARLQEHYHTVGSPAATLRAMLDGGEYLRLQSKIMEASGLATSLDEQVQTAKN